jgi:hypothetical protein
MKTKILFTFLLSFVLILTSIQLSLAAPPFITSESMEGGLRIDALVYQNVPIKQDFNLHIHVYNTTSGLNVSNLTTKCYLHLYNSSGNFQILYLITVAKFKSTLEVGEGKNPHIMRACCIPL